MRPKSHAGALPPWSGSDANPVWRLTRPILPHAGGRLNAERGCEPRLPLRANRVHLGRALAVDRQHRVDETAAARVGHRVREERVAELADVELEPLRRLHEADLSVQRLTSARSR